MSQEFREEISTPRKVTRQSKRKVALSSGFSLQLQPEREGILLSDLQQPNRQRDETISPHGKYYSVHCALAEAWPSDADLRLIHGSCTKDIDISHDLFNNSYSGLQSQGKAFPQDLLQLPPSGAHPVVIVRRFLLMGAYLRQAPLEISDDAAYSGHGGTSFEYGCQTGKI